MSITNMDLMDDKLNQAARKEEKSFWGFFVKNFRITYLILGSILLLGFWGLFTLPRESEPEVKVPYAVVTDVYLGANPSDIEELVTNKIEDKINNLENLRRYTSTSGLGFSSVFVEFEAEANLQESFQKLREAVDEAAPTLPAEAEKPVVTEIRMADYPIITYSLIGDYSDAQLKIYADKVQEALEGIKDVSKVEVIGGLEREFQIILNQNSLAQYNLSLGQVVSAISSNNFNLPAGEIEIDGYRYNVRIKGKINQATDLNGLVVATFNNSPVFLNDIAEIKDSYRERKNKSHIGFPNETSRNTISLQIYKKTGGNIINMVDEANALIANAQTNDIVPPDLAINVTNDNSKYIKDDLNILGSSAIQTFILIALILLAILSVRGAIITALAVPIAFLISFFFLRVQDMTLNSMVLFALVLSLGLMVDNAIVIIEGINEYVEKYKKSIYKAALLSIWNFKRPIISGTLTTVFAFVPMLLVSGIMGQYMAVLPKTLTVTLLSSLFVALIIIPTLATRLLKVKHNGTHSQRNKKRHIFIKKEMNKLYRWYINLMVKIIPHKKKRRRIIVTAWVLFLLAIAVPAAGLMKIQMFPQVDFDYFYINVELPVGSTLEQTDQIMSQVEKEVINIPELDNYVTNVGSAVTDGGFGSSDSIHKGSIIVNLTDPKERKRKSFDIAKDLREHMTTVQGAEVTVDEIQAGPPSGSPLEVRIIGKNSVQASLLSEQIKKFFEELPGTINVRTSVENAPGEFSFQIDRQKANYYGLNVSSVASTIRGAVYGTTASSVNLDKEDIDIVVKYDKEKFTSIDDINNLLLQTPQGTIALKQIATVTLEPALLAINHRDGENIVTVTADLEKGANLQLLVKEFKNYQASLDIPSGFQINVGGETEEIEESFQDMFSSMIVAVFLILVVLVLQFNSFKQPFIILFSFPLSIIGVIIGLNLLQQPFSITVFIGIVSLAGIVVNDAIVLIDRINKNIKNDMSLYKAVIDGGIARMQPIILTSLTTIAGIIPLIYANAMWRGLSLTIIFGLIFSTALNLIFVPILYTSMHANKK